MSDEREPAGDGTFKRNLVRVMTVQVVTLVLLWLLQRHFSS
jgi:hypothetical protein